MPLTPLHYGLLAPINHFFPGKISVISFTLVTVLIDGRLIAAALTGNTLPDHTYSHTFVGAMTIAVLVGMVGVRSGKWVFGAYFAALTHVVLDSLVHHEIEPFLPSHTDNPFYWGDMQTLSLILLPFMIWFIVQFVSYSRDWTYRRWSAFQAWRYRP